MKFAVDFSDPGTGEVRTVVVQLDEEETRKANKARADGKDPDGMWGLAYAMRHAYRQAPKGFLHVARSIRHVLH